MRVVTFNIQHALRPDKVVDVDLLADACVSLDADVLALQEVHINSPRSGNVDMADIVAEATGTTCFFAAAVERDGFRFGNALLTRGAIVDAEVVRFPADTEPRAAAVATLEIDGFPPIAVAAGHLGLRGQGEGELVTLLDRLSTFGRPRLVLGDLNVESAAVRETAEPLGYTVVGGEPTWPARRPRRRIDHVLVDGLMIGDVWTTELPVSDHRALSVVVSDP
jgi:endonuclease/exonuclease/phosphatase family metal-dependent hydrolase